MTLRDACLSIFALCVPVVAAGVGCSSGSDGEIQPLVLGLQERLKPERGAVLGFSGVRRDRTGVHASWDVQTGMEWRAYAGWVDRRMPPDFKKLEGDGAALAFQKSLPGDSFVLRIEPVTPADGPARVRVTFDGYPY